MTHAPDVTVLLQRAQRGDAAAAEELLPRIYGELHDLAERLMRHERTEHTLQATALIHEAWARMVGGDAPAWESQAHFLRLAARAMRNVLVDHARKRSAVKRGEGARVDKQALDGMVAALEENRLDLVELDGALDELARSHERQARVVELRFFGGLSVPETARVLGLSVSSVEREWRAARSWFRKRMPDVRPE